MIHRRALAYLSFALLAAAPQEDLTSPPNDKNLDAIRDFILPKPKELAYRAIAWRTTFWDAVVEAQEKDMPILLWAMNGHPLACT
jgi:hypothetical protein